MKGIVSIAALICCIATVCGHRLFVRRNINTLTSAQVDSFKRGIKVMMSRDVNDPTSWWYQANIHGTKLRPKVAWSTCQHGSWFFFIWHRMYLYFFERMLRKASGDPSFTLSYWKSSEDRSLPAIYRQPASSSNPLYVRQRCDAVNAGRPLPVQIVDYQRDLMYVNFDSPQDSDVQSFGGNALPFKFHSIFGQGGALETQMHNPVHIYVGGSNGGWMTDPDLAANDPIFWGHHTNIDRVWEEWLRQGNRSNPTESIWRNMPFTFFDENRNEVTLRGSQLLTTQQYGYIYDDALSTNAKTGHYYSVSPWVPKSWWQQGSRYTAYTTPASANNGYRPQAPSRAYRNAEDENPHHEKRATNTEQFSTKQLASLRPLRPVVYTVLSTVRSQHTVPMDEATLRGRQPVAVGNRRHNSLKFTGINNRQGAIYDVYINLPPGTKHPEPLGPNYAGILAPFALKLHGSHASMPSMPSNASISLDVTHLVAVFDRNHSWPSNHVNLTFISISCDTPKGTAKKYKPSRGPLISFNNVHLTETDVMRTL